MENTPETKAESRSGAVAEQAAPLARVAEVSDPAEHKRKRTTGNKVFDWVVYPAIAFGAVFALSVAVVYQARYGKGTFKNKYNEWTKSLSEKMHNSGFFKFKTDEEIDKKAGNYVLVLISFAVGTALMLPIKLFEDSREKLSKFFDRALGTTPEDPSQYAAEPKQGWRSVFGGRALTFGTVLTLSTFIDKIGDKYMHKVADYTEKTWHKRNPQATPDALKKVNGIAFSTAFEAFYTSLCAVMVYFISRGLARMFNRKEEEKELRRQQAMQPPVDVTPAPAAELPKESFVSKFATIPQRSHAKNVLSEQKENLASAALA